MAWHAPLRDPRIRRCGAPRSRLADARPTGFALWDKSFGAADYAVMFGFLLLALRPTLSARAIGLGAFGICFALELLQLTGIPRHTPQPLRFLLGSSFAWHDVACYAIGAAAVAVIVRVSGNRATAPAPTPEE